MHQWGKNFKQKFLSAKHSISNQQRPAAGPDIRSRVVGARRLLAAKYGTGAAGYVTKVAVILVIAIFSAYVPGIIDGVAGSSLSRMFGARALVDTGNIDLWWPTEGAVMQGSQPIKALLKDQKVENYRMYWQVDGGRQNAMRTSYQDWPHKESLIDYTSWTWKGNGPYVITVKAVSLSGKVLGQKSITVRTGAQQTQVMVQTATLASAEPSAPTGVSAAPVEVWWPSNNASIGGTTPFKAMLPNKSVESYIMYWQVDGGQLNAMDNNYTDYPHKEVLVNVGGWSWNGSGPYAITFVAKDSQGTIIGKSTVSVTINGGSSPAPAPSTTTQSPPAGGSTAQPAPAPVVTSGGNPFAGAKLFAGQSTPAKQQADAWRNSRPDDARQLDKIANQPSATWIGGWNANVRADVDRVTSAYAAQGAMPVFVAYNIPQRDCGSYSAGGVGSPEEYKRWIREFAAGINGRKAAVILEPDGLSLITCLSESDKQVRFGLIKDAVSVFRAAGAAVYIDAGHSSWISAQEMSGRLKQAGIESANGFALNTSNFRTTGESVGYGEQVSGLIGGKHFVVDTARNGLGPASDNQWCNPSGRALGERPTASTGNGLVDAYLWVKTPGESDGNCNGGPNAGVFWSDYALGLAQRASW